jgi:putative copper export protein
VSAVDGHATAGAYAFGVREAPTGRAPAAQTSPPGSLFEILARWIFLIGVVALLGSAAATIGGFGGDRAWASAAYGWLLAIVGALLLAEAQRRNAAASFAALGTTPIGRALLRRLAAIASAGAALAVARSRGPRFRHAGWVAVLLSTMAAIAVHLTAGHAAAVGAWPLATIGVQWVHFVAVAIWIGGLAVLVLEIGGGADPGRSASIRRFSTVAGVCLLAVAATGVVRAVGELSSWRDLSGTTYGLTVGAKAILIIAIASIGAFNRWRGVLLARVDVRPLRRAAGAELALAVVALAATAALGASPPPAALEAPPGLDASGVDFGTSVRVHLTAPSDQPGPNRFVVNVLDYDSRAPVPIRSMSLMFAPLDDPGAAPTSLLLAPGAADSFVGSGANLAFEGRWRITAVIERAGDAVEVPMVVETRSGPQFVSTLRVPGQPPEYTIEVRGKGRVRLVLHPERSGRSELSITCFDGIFEDLPIETLVVTSAAGTGSIGLLPARRLDRSRFAAEIVLASGVNRIAVTARTIDGTRLRATLNVQVR